MIFLSQFKMVQLPDDTFLLCERIGFVWEYPIIWAHSTGMMQLLSNLRKADTGSETMFEAVQKYLKCQRSIAENKNGKVNPKSLKVVQKWLTLNDVLKDFPDVS